MEDEGPDGDELLEEADGVATRATTIDAPSSAVWPWIAQMGPAPRGGAYTYDWIENLPLELRHDLARRCACSGRAGSLVMERKMLLGIKQRAERLARDGDAAKS